MHAPAAAATTGCAAYAVPGRGADFRQMGLTTAQRDQQTDPSISKLLDRKRSLTIALPLQ